MRKVATHTNGTKTATVYRDVPENECQVRLSIDGGSQPDATYFTDCQDDANATAQAMVGLSVLSPSRLLNWINIHNCGVSPCGVANDDGSITIRVADNGNNIHCPRVWTLAQARAALGY